MKKIAITGASGFVGKNLKRVFTKEGYTVVAIKREVLKDVEELTRIVDGCKAVINLAGANIIHRWSEEYKKLLYSSRIDTTKALVEAMENAPTKPEVFISTSAIGIYDTKRVYNEEDYEYSGDFLGNLCRDWEEEALKAAAVGIRTSIFRFGIVLGEEGALQKMLPAFQLGIGGTIGDGKQAFSFIHISDLVKAYQFVLEDEYMSGIFNLTAPVPTTNYGLTKALGKSLHRPTVIPLPKFVLSLIFGEGSTVLTQGQCVYPKRLLDSGFEFEFETIEDTIEDLVVEPKL